MLLWPCIKTLIYSKLIYSSKENFIIYVFCAQKMCNSISHTHSLYKLKTLPQYYDDFYLLLRRNSSQFILDQQVILPISCTQSTINTSERQATLYANNFAISRLFFLSLSNEALLECRKKVLKFMQSILRNIRRRIAKKLLGIYIAMYLRIALISLTY